MEHQDGLLDEGNHSIEYIHTLPFFQSPFGREIYFLLGPASI